jgi:hypothetical protein
VQSAHDVNDELVSVYLSTSLFVRRNELGYGCFLSEIESHAAIKFLEQFADGIHQILHCGRTFLQSHLMEIQDQLIQSELVINKIVHVHRNQTCICCKCSASSAHNTHGELATSYSFTMRILSPFVCQNVLCYGCLSIETETAATINCLDHDADSIQQIPHNGLTFFYSHLMEIQDQLDDPKHCSEKVKIWHSIATTPVAPRLGS